MRGEFVLYPCAGSVLMLAAMLYSTARPERLTIPLLEMLASGRGR